MMCRHPKLIEIDQLIGVTIDIDGQKGNVVGSFQWKKYICDECKCLITVLQAVVEAVNIKDKETDNAGK